MFLQRCNLPAHVSFRVWGCHVWSYLGPDRIRLQNICYRFPWQQEWWESGWHVRFKANRLFFFLPHRCSVFQRKPHCETKHACQIYPGGSGTVLTLPCLHQTGKPGRTCWNNSDINTATEHWLNPSGPVLIQLKGAEPVEWSCDKRYHPSCWDSGEPGIDSGESRLQL